VAGSLFLINKEMPLAHFLPSSAKPLDLGGIGADRGSDVYRVLLRICALKQRRCRNKGEPYFDFVIDSKSRMQVEKVPVLRCAGCWRIRGQPVLLSVTALTPASTQVNVALSPFEPIP
jgi:hypothetical protein